MSRYRHIFFDLDHTLWDFETNSRLALGELYHRYALNQLLKTEEEDFLKTYYQVNEEKWELYRNGKIEKDELRVCRVRDTFGRFGYVDEQLCRDFDHEYLQLSPSKTALIPHAEEVLKYLVKNYQLHIITNGFNEVQSYKISQSGLKPYFQHIISSESIGVNKPSPKIFQESLLQVGADCKESLMIGDNLEADIVGARNCGIDQVYFNSAGKPHSEKVTFEIRCLSEIRALL